MSIGADGLMVVEAATQGGDYKMIFFNADGSEGEMCGNGARCICRFAYSLGLVGESMTVQTDAGLVYGQRLSEDRYRVQLNLPGVVDLRRRSDAAYVELGDPGIPHCVTHVPGLTFDQKAQLLPLAKELRHDPVFPKGVNVNFYDWLDETTIRLLTYERGVEDYTLACGTGSGSVATVLWLTAQLPNGALTVENPGGTLGITVKGSGTQLTQLLLEGPATVLDIYEA
jgi:diaminopimelate epimerase